MLTKSLAAGLMFTILPVGEPDTAMVLPANCYEGMCMVKKEHLESILQSHNAYRSAARKCEKGNSI